VSSAAKLGDCDVFATAERFVFAASIAAARSLSILFEHVDFPELVPLLDGML
jgi:hypothetical protein